MTDPLEYPEFTSARRARGEIITQILRRRRPVPDAAFDDVYPEAIRSVSWVHWTPVQICARVVELLAVGPNERVIDVGAGAGKFCIVAAAMSGARLCGIERMTPLVAVAREAARRFGVDVDFREGELRPSDAETVDAAYFFNPFAEVVQLDGPSALGPSRTTEAIAADVAVATQFLERARAGMRVVTFCGLGGPLPDSYERTVRQWCEGGALEVWVKRA